MPLNYKILEKVGTTQERLKKLFTAGAPGNLPPDATEEQKQEAELDYAMRKKIEELLIERIDASIQNNLRSAHLVAAVDLAWDSSLIVRQTIPLVMYAQRRIDQEACIQALTDLQCQDQYVTRDKDGKQKLELPRFCDVTVNLVRSIITRRVAAQSARFTNLYPFFRYDPRGTSEADKLRGDLMSQRSDIMSDQYGYRWQQVQWIRDMLLYPHAVAFPSRAWDREVEWVDENEDMAVEFKGDEPKFKNKTVREGVPWVTPHPSRVFYDSNHPIQSINTDTGCEWFGFWDVTRYSDILDNPDYFNRQEIGYSPDSTSLFYTYATYFSQYYTRLSPPISHEQLSSANDRKALVGSYNTGQRDSAVYLTHFYWKVRPNQWRMGKYPYCVWLHLVVAGGTGTVVYAEIMPDCPGAVFSFNTSAQRLVNLSMAHELMPWQDQITNLYSELLATVQRDLFQVAILNIDAFPAENPESKEMLQKFRDAMRNVNFFASPQILEASLIKMKDLGVDLESVFRVIQMPPNSKLTEIVRAIAETFQLAERVMAMSPQEQAQLSPRETSATEVQIIAGTTENLFQFISDAIDEGRNAMKRYIYNALMSLGQEEIFLPVVNRYRQDVVQKAGFTIEEEDVQTDDPSRPRLFTVRGVKRLIQAEYIFSTRDGAERSSNPQAAQILVQLLGVLMQPAVLALLTQEKLADLINAIIRQSGAGVDVLVEPSPGSGASPVLNPAAMQPQAQAVGAPAALAAAAGQ